MFDFTKTQGVVYPFASLGLGINELDSFDDAEVKAGIEALNAVRVTSFVPVGPERRWELYDDPEIVKILKKGIALPMAYQNAYSGDKYVGACVAIGLNEDPQKPGIIMEYAEAGKREDELEEIAVESVERAFERREGYGWELGEIYTQKRGGYPADGLMACALVGVIFIGEEYPGFGEKV